MDRYPFQGVGFGARLARCLGPLRFSLGGRIGQGQAGYIDKYGDDPAIKAERTEVAGMLGIEFRIPGRG